MRPLSQLHDGSWVVLADITRIIPRAKEDDQPSVLVCMGKEYPIKLYFETREAAHDYADVLAEDVNAAKMETGS
jgi:hypothetical protein